jgi:hypothetical protein
MSRGAGFTGSLSNVDVTRDSSIDHLNIEKSPRLHKQVLGAVLAAVGKDGDTKPKDPAQTPAKPADGGTGSTESATPR